MISVIITIFNREKTIVAAIESCLSQDFKDFEIILIDDGSTDNSAALVKKYINSNVRYYYQENKGAAAAKNRGVVESKYNYVTFLDSDDLYSCNDALSLMSSKLSQGVDFICANSIVIRNESNDLILKNVDINIEVDFYRHMLNSPLNYAGYPSYAFRKDKFLSCGGFDINSKWGDALIFWRRFFQERPKVEVIDKPIYVYNQIDTNSISRSRNQSYYLKAIDVMWRCYIENIDCISKYKYEKKWQFIFLIFALRSRTFIKSFEMFRLFFSGRFYLIPEAIKYIYLTKVKK